MNVTELLSYLQSLGLAISLKNKLKTLQSRRLLQGLIKQRDVELSSRTPRPTTPDPHTLNKRPFPLA